MQLISSSALFACLPNGDVELNVLLVKATYKAFDFFQLSYEWKAIVDVSTVNWALVMLG